MFLPETESPQAGVTVLQGKLMEEGVEADEKIIVRVRARRARHARLSGATSKLYRSIFEAMDGIPRL